MKYSCKFLAMFAAFMLFAVVSGVAQKVERPTEQVEGICFVKEFGFVPELETWQKIDTSKHDDLRKDDQKALERSWDKTWRAKLEKAVSAKMVRELVVGTKRKGIERYEEVTIPKTMEWRPVTKWKTDSRHLMVITGKLDDLPRVRHSTVRRWVNAVCIYDVTNKSILRVTVQVEGTRGE